MRKRRQSNIICHHRTRKTGYKERRERKVILCGSAAATDTDVSAGTNGGGGGILSKSGRYCFPDTDRILSIPYMKRGRLLIFSIKNGLGLPPGTAGFLMKLSRSTIFCISGNTTEYSSGTLNTNQLTVIIDEILNNQRCPTVAPRRKRLVACLLFG